MVKAWDAYILTGMYIIGSATFISGATLFHPKLVSRPNCYEAGVSMFITGSAFFLIASIYEWCSNLKAQITSNDKTQPSEEKEELLRNPDEPQRNNFMKYVLNVFLTRGTLSVLINLFFLVGSVMYWPTINQGIVGNWLYRVGSTLTSLSNIYALIRCLIPPYKSTKSVVMVAIFHILFALGGLEFFAGGFCFLFHKDEVGSILWAVGSFFFLLGSCELLIM
ncbi:hypothetical protein AKO1_011321 [Acrasis kona]|uniref:YrhK domain-containing protein n=1 Tax=Acrasis kona TaxID=1008807 RepID=A0AAW2YYZ8_9EUKA